MNDVRVKICGLTNLEDAQVAAEAGADLLGFIFYPKSPRYVAPERVKEIIKALSGGRLETSNQRPAPSLQSPISHSLKFVGVFVNETVDQVTTILAQTGLDYAQLHGNEPSTMLVQLQARAYKAIRPASPDEALADAEQFGPLGISDGPCLMVDAYDPNLYGGTGKAADWHVVAALAQRYPGLLLAGSLTPENVTAAIRTAQPWGVDVSSGVEAAPGKKDHQKVRAFVERAKNGEM